MKKVNKILELIRLEEFNHGTIGVLKINKEVVCFTLEPNDIENARNKSSIPAQQYIVKPRQSPRFGKVYRVENVPGRSQILFHWGNIAKHTEGCIILGTVVGDLTHRRAVLNSKTAFNMFMEYMNNEEGILTVSEVY